MSTKQMPATQPQFSPNLFGLLGPAGDYMVDAAQRTVLFWDVMRQRGDQYREHLAQTVPHVLSYEAYRRWANAEAPGELRARADRAAGRRHH